MINKNGSFFPILLFFILLIGVLVVGFILSIGSGTVSLVSDEVSPLLNLGVIDGVNYSEATLPAVTPVNTIVQSLPMIIGFLYVACLIFSVIFIVSSKSNPHPAFIGVYFAFMILLIFTSIIISNMYQDIRGANDDIGTRLQGQTLMGYMMLYSPTILTLVAVVSGIFLFSRRGDGEVDT